MYKKPLIKLILMLVVFSGSSVYSKAFLEILSEDEVEIRDFGCFYMNFIPPKKDGYHFVVDRFSVDFDDATPPWDMNSYIAAFKHKWDSMGLKMLKVEIEGHLQEFLLSSESDLYEDEYEYTGPEEFLDNSTGTEGEGSNSNASNGSGGQVNGSQTPPPPVVYNTWTQYVPGPINSSYGFYHNFTLLHRSLGDPTYNETSSAPPKGVDGLICTPKEGDSNTEVKESGKVNEEGEMDNSANVAEMNSRSVNTPLEYSPSSSPNEFSGASNAVSRRLIAIDGTGDWIDQLRDNNVYNSDSPIPYPTRPIPNGDSWNPPIVYNPVSPPDNYVEVNPNGNSNSSSNNNSSDSSSDDSSSNPPTVDGVNYKFSAMKEVKVVGKVKITANPTLLVKNGASTDIIAEITDKNGSVLSDPVPYEDDLIIKSSNTSVLEISSVQRQYTGASTPVPSFKTTGISQDKGGKVTVTASGNDFIIPDKVDVTVLEVKELTATDSNNRKSKNGLLEIVTNAGVSESVTVDAILNPPLNGEQSGTINYPLWVFTNPQSFPTFLQSHDLRQEFSIPEYIYDPRKFAENVVFKMFASKDEAKKCTIQCDDKTILIHSFPSGKTTYKYDFGKYAKMVEKELGKIPIFGEKLNKKLKLPNGSSEFKLWWDEKKDNTAIFCYEAKVGYSPLIGCEGEILLSGLPGFLTKYLSSEAGVFLVLSGKVDLIGGATRNKSLPNGVCNIEGKGELGGGLTVKGKLNEVVQLIAEGGSKISIVCKTYIENKKLLFSIKADCGGLQIKFRIRVRVFGEWEYTEEWQPILPLQVYPQAGQSSTPFEIMEWDN